jgi:hypothetical protein
MRVVDLIPTSEAARALAPEELASAMLQVMNSQVDAGRGAGTKFHLGNFCSDTSREYQNVNQSACDDAIAAAWHELVLAGLLIPHPDGNEWYFVSPRGRAIRSSSDYDHFRKASIYPRGSIHHAIESETYAEFLRGDYETAVFKAFKAIEVAVRTAGGLDAYSGPS